MLLPQLDSLTINNPTFRYRATALSLHAGLLAFAAAAAQVCVGII